jgi:hypothetical protein
MARIGPEGPRNHSDTKLCFLENNPPPSSHAISQALFIPETIDLRVLADLELKFYKARWIPHRLSCQQMADRITLSQFMSDIMAASDRSNKNSL